ncbi:hypothetical protein N656DRAFT_15605 [Canariomyces notabilis]|uniref:Uncharacterized protein n=1 Tax=Canariomyces notabilis TaxID=2074819 RepID=A0AAN6TMH0_9PEZI|nr:hypothetical protein N656DRAFT_15605 [Canariomyces arenarius]
MRPSYSSWNRPSWGLFRDLGSEGETSVCAWSPSPHSLSLLLVFFICFPLSVCAPFSISALVHNPATRPNTTHDRLKEYRRWFMFSAAGEARCGIYLCASLFPPCIPRQVGVR